MCPCSYSASQGKFCVGSFTSDQSTATYYLARTTARACTLIKSLKNSCTSLHFPCLLTACNISIGLSDHDTKHVPYADTATTPLSTKVHAADFPSHARGRVSSLSHKRFMHATTQSCTCINNVGIRTAQLQWTILIIFAQFAITE